MSEKEFITWGEEFMTVGVTDDDFERVLRVVMGVRLGGTVEVGTKLPLVAKLCTLDITGNWFGSGTVAAKNLILI